MRLINLGKSTSAKKSISHAKLNFNRELAPSTLATWISKTINHSLQIDGTIEYKSNDKGHQVEIPEEVEIAAKEKLEHFLGKGVHITQRILKYVSIIFFGCIDVISKRSLIMSMESGLSKTSHSDSDQNQQRQQQNVISLLLLCNDYTISCKKDRT